MHRYSLTRLSRLWRAGADTWWPDAVLTAVLSVAVVWLTIKSSNMWSDPHALVYLRPPAAIPAAATDPPGWVMPADGATQVPLYATETRGWGVLASDLFFNLVTAGALLWRRRWPLACFAVQFIPLVVFDFDANSATLAAVMIGAYSLAVHGRSALLSIGTMLAAGGLAVSFETDTWPQLPTWAGVFAILLPIALFGVAIRIARSRAQASEQRAEALEREQQAATHLAVARERARIARELHDVVSHHVSVMTIQAGAAGKVLDAAPELARNALSAIETSGRETMTELRHLLGVLTPGPTDDLLHPQPGLDQLDALIDNVRRAGQPVSVHRAPIALPHGLNLTAYRVVQEALTNALRYAPGAQTDITITTEPCTESRSESRSEPSTVGRTAVVIEVTNDAAPPGAPPGSGADTGSGSGLLGLTERLHLYGGTLETGGRPGGGFRLKARMPLDPTFPLDNPPRLDARPQLDAPLRLDGPRGVGSGLDAPSEAV